jgi:triacylglycerol lipase
MTLLYTLVAAFLLLLAFDRLAPATAARLGIAFERRRSGLALKQMQVGSASMPYLEGGSGEAMVLVHGFGGDKDNFTRIARLLTGSYQVVIPDLPGFGEASRDPRASYGIADQVANLHGFLQTLGITRAHLGGNSMGGFIVAEYAARYPDQVASLWLLDAAGTEASFDNALIRRYRDTGEMPLLLQRPEQAGELMRACMYRAPFLPHCVKLQLGRRGVADLALHTRIMQQVHQSPLLENQFNAIETPALIVWGSEDKILSPAGAAALGKILPNSQVDLMPEIGHLPMIEAPGRTAARYLSFLRALPSQLLAA